jgi:hypothetical protein
MQVTLGQLPPRSSSSSVRPSCALPSCRPTTSAPERCPLPPPNGASAAPARGSQAAPDQQRGRSLERQVQRRQPSHVNLGDQPWRGGGAGAGLGLRLSVAGDPASDEPWHGGPRESGGGAPAWAAHQCGGPARLLRCCRCAAPRSRPTPVSVPVPVPSARVTSQFPALYLVFVFLPHLQILAQI